MVHHAPADTNSTVLRCAGIERSFGGLKALKGVNLDVHRGILPPQALAGMNVLSRSLRRLLSLARLALLSEVFFAILC